MVNPFEKETTANPSHEDQCNKEAKQVVRKLNTNLKDLVNKEICHIMMKGKREERTNSNMASAKNFKDEEIKKEQSANNEEKFDKQNDSAQKYIYNTTQFVSVTGLYDVVGICNNNPVNNEWCPVLLKIGTDLKRHETC